MSCEPPDGNRVTGSAYNYASQANADNKAYTNAIEECAEHLDNQPTDSLIEYSERIGGHSRYVAALERRRETDVAARTYLERRERDAEERRRREEERLEREALERREREAAEQRRRDDLTGTLTGLAAAMRRMEETVAATEAALDDIDAIDCNLSENFGLPECY